jgi:hypothetical protein
MSLLPIKVCSETENLEAITEWLCQDFYAICILPKLLYQSNNNITWQKCPAFYYVFSYRHFDGMETLHAVPIKPQDQLQTQFIFRKHHR